ncbi:MAG: hypothetical protein MJB14_07305 [Spirochaetes bacterium]|nr:hypothetical protein [Spirochaetota bacterium]
MIITDNAAHRLTTILEQVRKSQDNDKLFDIWAKALNVHNNDRSTVYRRLSYVANLPDEITEQIYQYERIDKDLYLSWKNNVSKLLNYNNLDANWSGIKNWIPNESMTALSFCSAKISETIESKEIDDKEIYQLILDAEKLLGEVEPSDLSYEIKFFIIERLKGVISALSGCSVYGPNKFKSEFENAIGSMALQQHIVQMVSETPCKRKFWDIMGRFATVISIATFCFLTAPQELNKYLDAPTAKSEIISEKSTSKNITPEKDNIPDKDEKQDEVIDVEFTKN